ncbi:hypothetical protein [Meridianimarinicoccus marinus]|uniref:hypothetical protein n=1 Tax=Meridianimarinicoccus marinus TaxID=3231483 RepID=UPI00344B1002
MLDISGRIACLRRHLIPKSHEKFRKILVPELADLFRPARILSRVRRFPSRHFQCYLFLINSLPILALFFGDTWMTSGRAPYAGEIATIC